MGPRHFHPSSLKYTTHTQHWASTWSHNVSPGPVVYWVFSVESGVKLTQWTPESDVNLNPNSLTKLNANPSLHPEDLMSIMRLCVPLAEALLLSCLCAVPLRGQKPGQVDPFSAYRAEPQCWDSSSARLLKMRSPKIADTVPAFWDLMVFLKASDNRKHTALFWDLAQVFWDIYVDCVLARSHGLGRRGLKLPKDRITSVHTLVTDRRCLRFTVWGDRVLSDKQIAVKLLQVEEIISRVAQDQSSELGSGGQRSQQDSENNKFIKELSGSMADMCLASYHCDFSQCFIYR